MKVSVIVPAWGRTPHLDEALASVRAQTYPDVELVVVAPPPDGPQTLPAARQEGLARATGELVTFCDADDWLDRDAVDRMVQAMADDVDVVCCGLIRERADGSHVIRPFDRDGPSDTYNALVNKLFRRSVLTGLVVNATIGLGEDLMVTAQVLAKARGIAVVDCAFYHYRENPQSMTHRQTGRLRVLDLARVGALLRDVMPDPRYDDFHDRVTRDAMLLWIRHRVGDRDLWRELRGCLKGGLLADPRHGLLKKGALFCASCLFD